MIVFKHKKMGDVSFVSHIDTLRILQRSIKRARFEIEYSQGFNPHMRTFFGQPLSLGIESVAEYLAVEVKESDTAECLRRFNESAPSGLQAENAVFTQKNPNLAKNIMACDYEVEIKDINISALDEIANAKSVVMELKQKGKIVEKEVADKIFALSAEDGILKMRLGVGSNNLRPDSLIEFLNANAGLKTVSARILRTNQLALEDGVFIDADKFLRRFM